MKRKALSELNLMDNFLFGSVVTYPGIGEEFSRKLLKIIFGRDFGKLRITPQKVYYGSDTELHGARLDVYIEEDDERMFREMWRRFMTWSLRKTKRTQQ